MAMLIIIINQGEASGQKTTWVLVISRLIRDSGKRNFQANDITWSIRRRGRVLRIQTIKKKTENAFIKNQRKGGSRGPLQPPRKRMVISAESTTASLYSARKNVANFIPENSML